MVELTFCRNYNLSSDYKTAYHFINSVFIFLTSTPTYIPVALSELKNLHKAVEELYHHLDLHKPNVFSSSTRHSTKTKHKSSDDEENFLSIHQRIKQFEGELVRQKASQHTEILRFVWGLCFLKDTTYLIKNKHDP